MSKDTAVEAYKARKQYVVVYTSVLDFRRGVEEQQKQGKWLDSYDVPTPIVIVAVFVDNPDSCNIERWMRAMNNLEDKHRELLVVNEGLGKERDQLKLELERANQMTKSAMMMPARKPKEEAN